jgi:hypothetical protein
MRRKSLLPSVIWQVQIHGHKNIVQIVNRKGHPLADALFYYKVFDDCQNSIGMAFTCLAVKTGPSLQT